MTDASPCVRRTRFAVLLFLMTLTLLYGCVADRPKTLPADHHASGERAVVAIFPVGNMVQLYGIHRSVADPISGDFFMTGEVMENAEDFLADAVVARLTGHPRLDLITPKQVKEALPAFQSAGGGIVKKDQVIAAGRKMTADYALVGYVYRFKQRVGKRYAVETPASAAFGFHLLDLPEGYVIWSGVFNETQQALSEDLLTLKAFIQRKGRWVTAEDLAQEGLDKIMKDFPLK
ncbi:MAG: hypothetical protein R6U50_06830 [Desulfobacterales bacterium]